MMIAVVDDGWLVGERYVMKQETGVDNQVSDIIINTVVNERISHCDHVRYHHDSMMTVARDSWLITVRMCPLESSRCCLIEFHQ